MRTRDEHELHYLRWSGRPTIYAVRQHYTSAAEKETKQTIHKDKRKPNEGRITYLVNGPRDDMSEG